MISIHRLFTLVPNRPACRRPVLRAFALSGALIVGTAAAADAQSGARRSTSIQRVQATPAAEGARSWGQDNCFYIFQSGAWRSADLCRVMRARAVYDTYAPSTRKWGVRMDESEAGWTGILDLNGANPNAWFKFSTNGSGAVLALVNGRWHDFNALAAAQRGSVVPNPRTAAQASPARTLKPGEIAPGVRINLPTNQALWTPEEKRWVDRMNGEAIGRMSRTMRTGSCERAQAPAPYDSNGKIADGWYGTILEPQRGSC